MIMLSGAQKKLIQIFKTFVEKAIIPQLKKIDGSLVQWNKFSAFMLAEPININEMQIYVDTMPYWGINNNRKSEVDVADVRSFEGNKSFGGGKTNNQLIQTQPLDTKQNTSFSQRVTQSSSNNIMTNLQKLLKSLQENQNIIDGLVKDNSQPTSIKSNRESTNIYNTNGNATISSHSYGYISSQAPSMQPTMPAPPFSQHYLQSSGGLNYYKSYY